MQEALSIFLIITAFVLGLFGVPTLIVGICYIVHNRIDNKEYYQRIKENKIVEKRNHKKEMMEFKLQLKKLKIDSRKNQHGTENEDSK